LEKSRNKRQNPPKNAQNQGIMGKDGKKIKDRLGTLKQNIYP